MSDNNITAMPGVTLPAVQAEQKQQADEAFVAVLEELTQMARDGKIRWVAVTGQFDTGQKLSLFGNMTQADPVYVLGALTLLEQEYLAALRGPAA
jgi:rhamnogalacturonyl hydrolase YesR